MAPEPAPATAAGVRVDRHPLRPPEVVIIGAMKCGTTALHRYLDQHPQVSMSQPKELNFFLGPEHGTGAHGAAPTGPGWLRGNWSRGADWYARQFDPAARVRGEASPGYTSPDHLKAARRMAHVAPDALLIYLVREPFARALSQYRHHRREGAETRSPEQALLDPASQYLARSRYHERLAPYLEWFGADRIVVVEQHDLLLRRRATLARLYGSLGIDDTFWSPQLAREWHVGDDDDPPVRRRLADAFAEAVADDVERFRQWLGRDLAHWSV